MSESMVFQHIYLIQRGGGGGGGLPPDWKRKTTSDRDNSDEGHLVN